MTQPDYRLVLVEIECFLVFCGCSTPLDTGRKDGHWLLRFVDQLKESSCVSCHEWHVKQLLAKLEHGHWLDGSDLPAAHNPWTRDRTNDALKQGGASPLATEEKLKIAEEFLDEKTEG